MFSLKGVLFKSQEVLERDNIQMKWHIEHTKLGSRVKCTAICVFFWEVQGTHCKGDE
jgi:hypothetical protein